MMLASEQFRPASCGKAPVASTTNCLPPGVRSGDSRPRGGESFARGRAQPLLHGCMRNADCHRDIAGRGERVASPMEQGANASVGRTPWYAECARAERGAQKDYQLAWKKPAANVAAPQQPPREIPHSSWRNLLA